MKKLLFTLAIMFGVVTMANAQNPGQIWVGGAVGIKSSKVKGMDANTSYRILPEIGYILTDNVAIAVSLGYEHNEGTVSYEDVEGNTLFGTGKTDGFKVNPFVRYSFLKGDIGSMFIDGGVGYMYSKTKGSDTKNHDLEIGFRPGVAVKVSDRLSLSAKYGFLGYEYSKEGNAKRNTFGFDFDFSQALVGVSFIF
ncbi:long-subunit fatty acid transport protein [Dysgonomonas sp. PFB1-18]|uniref:outer membrane beta-barrel protein n=1 Tax=unclassified Dysgonomonas TaxID=2630389 RepID=UPI00247574DD|nr:MULTISPECIES: outer membrane beta-barrel protein [unclassified Dysgonomonas]MDH6310221.1 long-subunit fatty acid transport protein [Dysgonomonas sp. PF1-14]MDH6340040.1 long-subunit fatty acid transport protein [Dysgonomonas sp. PF1-16]MDH6381853.1 long-subunit fatty acid transport protein [Dysgonomonas sp. PFB1-18]MDH6398905.1 long-subunit fatty acid transport protein [Dysgonomonas sp. PF1-23]